MRILYSFDVMFEVIAATIISSVFVLVKEYVILCHEDNTALLPLMIRFSSVFLVVKHFTMDYHEFSIYYGILFYNFPQ